jgi:hypothetical protein
LNPGLAISELKKLLSGSFGEPHKDMSVVGAQKPAAKA